MEYAICIVHDDGSQALLYVERNGQAAHHAVEYLKAMGRKVAVYGRKALPR